MKNRGSFGVHPYQNFPLLYFTGRKLRPPKATDDEPKRRRNIKDKLILAFIVDCQRGIFKPNFYLSVCALSVCLLVCSAAQTK